MAEFGPEGSSFSGSRSGSGVVTVTFTLGLGCGYRLADGRGSFAFGGIPFDGSLPALHVHVSDIVGMVESSDGGGYLLVGATVVFKFGDTALLRLTSSPARPRVGHRGHGRVFRWWRLPARGSDGGVFEFGDARYFGSLPALHVHVSDIVGMVESSDGGGYLLVGADGGVFKFGDTRYFGSLPALHVHVSDIVGMVESSDGGGYLLVGADGGVFKFGDTRYFGSLPALHVHVSDIVGMVESSDGGGYLLVGADGGVFKFGDTVFSGSLSARSLAAPIVAIT